MTIIKRVDQVSVKEEVVIDEVHTSLMTGSAEWNKMKSNGTVRYSTSHLFVNNTFYLAVDEFDVECQYCHTSVTISNLATHEVMEMFVLPPLLF